MLPLFATRVCVYCGCVVLLGWGCVVLTDATIVCHSIVCVCVYCGCVLTVPLFATCGRGCVVLTDATIVCHSCVCELCVRIGVGLGRGCVVLTDATIVCHSCVCVCCVCDVPLFATRVCVCVCVCVYCGCGTWAGMCSIN